MTETVERMLPLYEGKMGWQYDHRFASFSGVGDTEIEDNYERLDESVVLPRYWVRGEVVADRIARREWGCTTALLGFRRVARNTDERTSIASMVPFGAASYGWILSAGPTPRDLALLIAQFNSFAFDYVIRQFLSQPSIPQVTFGQLPILEPEHFNELDVALGDCREWIIDRVAYLVGSGAEMCLYLSDLERSVPVEWDADRRAACRIELDAAMFHLFGLSRDEVTYIMDTFPIVRRKDESASGTYLTKERILVVYDAIQTAIESGQPYESPLEPQLARLVETLEKDAEQ